VNEFTGERVVPGQVNDDLWAEHLARYAFAARYAAGKRVLDVGCGTGYGTAELAHQAQTAVGADVAGDAVQYARTHFAIRNVHFAQASASAFPFPDASFDIVTAFEVIEHLNDWRTLLAESRRVLRPDGVLFVSTPNRSYYAESREKDGPNPFHVHEFDSGEFQAALAEFFPGVSVFLQNWSESILFSPPPAKHLLPKFDARIDSPQPSHDTAHFFLAMCWIHAHPEPRAFVYSPKASNLLREREQHIRLLEVELEKSKEWVADARSERDAMIALHSQQKQHLEQSNRWAQQVTTDWKSALARVVRVQEELQAAQARASEVAAGYARKVAELEEENRQKTAWAIDIERRLSGDLAVKIEELAQTVSFLDRAEATVIERTLWAQNVQARLDQLEPQLRSIQHSRWTRLGRALGLGPQVDG